MVCALVETAAARELIGRRARILAVVMTDAVDVERRAGRVEEDDDADLRVER
jgi:hypothetical protein